MASDPGGVPLLRVSSRYRFSSFPQDGRIWKVDWFGAINFNPNVPSEPTIEIILTPFYEKRIDPKTTNRKASFDYKSMCTIPMGIGSLPIMTIDSLWKYGRQQAPTHYAYENLKG